MAGRRDARLYQVPSSSAVPVGVQMDVATFRRVYEGARGKIFHSPRAYSDYWEALQTAAVPDHVPTAKSSGFSDEVHCSCGWKSPGYWDLMEQAWDDWAEHVADEMGILPKKCPGCHKEYIPADGGSACHKIVPTS